MLKLYRQFGGKLTDELKNRYSDSPQWDGEKFINPVPTYVNVKLKDVPAMIRKSFFDKKGRSPEKILPVKPFDREKFLENSDEVKFIWYGHSVLLMRIAGKTILIDPMFGDNASPIAPFKTKRFSENTLQIIDDLPDIDLLLLTHDHYDHLDLDSIEKIKGKTDKYYVALGTARHLVKWGVDEENILEFDWWDDIDFNGISITFTPSRHFSGRGINDRAKSLWGGWVIKSEKENIYFSADGGYGEHFKDIGEKLGPFDIGFMECGQYNEKWHLIHMYPEESVLAGVDINSKVIVPVHWGGFSLALHHWKDPVRRFTVQAQKDEKKHYIPEIGKIFRVSDTESYNSWWEEYE